LVGPVQLLNSGTVDAKNGTVTLPLYKGTLSGSKKTVWYILTDVDNPSVAAELGLNFSAKLTFASNAARTGNLDANGNIVFDKGTVNFAPNRPLFLDRAELNSLLNLRRQGRLGMQSIVLLFAL